MTVGLEIYDEEGNVKVDMSKQLSRVVGQMTLQGTGSITNEDLGYPNNKLWYMIISNISPATSFEQTPVIRITDNGARIMWQNQVGTIIRYGIL